mmetsp:Transcript_6448/g.17224  ORF Transcript_6448/g.17224 Transcript_6448/m.17224 type:complete len:241 (-) Transcript_6448:164-886(-)
MNTRVSLRGHQMASMKALTCTLNTAGACSAISRSSMTAASRLASVESLGSHHDSARLTSRSTMSDAIAPPLLTSRPMVRAIVSMRVMSSAYSNAGLSISHRRFVLFASSPTVLMSINSSMASTPPRRLRTSCSFLSNASTRRFISWINLENVSELRLRASASMYCSRCRSPSFLRSRTPGLHNSSSRRPTLSVAFQEELLMPAELRIPTNPSSAPSRLLLPDPSERCSQSATDIHTTISQ